MRIFGHQSRVVSFIVWNDFLVSRSMDHSIRIWNQQGTCIKSIPEVTQFRGFNQLAIWNNKLVTFPRDIDGDGVIKMYPNIEKNGTDLPDMEKTFRGKS